MAIFWNPALGLAPLELRLRAPVRRYFRRVVVQLPQAQVVRMRMRARSPRRPPTRPLRSVNGDGGLAPRSLRERSPSPPITDEPGSPAVDGALSGGASPGAGSALPKAVPWKNAESIPYDSTLLGPVVYDCLDGKQFSTNGWVVYLPDWFVGPSGLPRAQVPPLRRFAALWPTSHAYAARHASAFRRVALLSPSHALVRPLRTTCPAPLMPFQL